MDTEMEILTSPRRNTLQGSLSDTLSPPSQQQRQGSNPQNSTGFATRRYFTKKVIISVLAVQATLGSAINLALNCATQNTLTWLDLCKNNSDINKHCSKWKGYAKESGNIPLLLFIVLMWAFVWLLFKTIFIPKQ